MACVGVMVQGDLTGLSLKHVIIASKTGFLTGLAMIIAWLICQREKKWLDISLTAAFTTIADRMAHPVGFGSTWTEAIVTGLGAGILAYIIQTHVPRKHSMERH